MESDRRNENRSGERPVTRWRREQESNEKSQFFPEHPASGLSRAYSKMERPISRRGIKTNITEFGLSRPPTSGRNVLSRPPSATFPTNRISVSASRINPINSLTLLRMNSALPRNFIERPVTQQGLTGIRPSSSKGVPKLTKQIQDKKHYQQLLELKIQELNQEIAVINSEVEKQMNQNTYEINSINSKEFNIQLTHVHNQLADYNAALDQITPSDNKDEIEREFRELKELDDHEHGKLEYIFKKHQLAENKLNELNKEIESKRKISGKNGEDLDIDSKHLFDEVDQKRNILQREIDKLRDEYEHLSVRKAELQEKIALSPIKQEAYKLYSKIFDVEKKRDKLLQNDKYNLFSDQEKEKIKVAESQILQIEKKIADAEQELKQLETDIDEDHLDKKTNNILKKQDDIMENFAAAFEKNKAKELEKLSLFEEQILERLEDISNNINGNIDSSILDSDEVELLRSLMEQNFVNKNYNEKSFEELKQDNLKLKEIAYKLEALEFKIKSEVSEYKDIPKKVGNQISHSNSEIYENVHEEKQKHFFRQKELNEEDNVNIKLESVKKNLSKLKEKIEKDESYRFISILQDKLGKFGYANESMTQSVEEENAEAHSLLKEKLFSLVAQYNTVLINDIASPFE